MAHDSSTVQQRREIQRAFLDHREVELATVDAYDHTAHTVNISLHRGGGATGVKVAYPFGFYDWKAGVTCTALLVLGAVVQVVAPVPTDDEPTPAHIALPMDTTVLGALRATGPLYPPTLTVLPPASAAWANSLVILAATPGTAATATTAATAAIPSQPHFCEDNGDGSYSWKAVTLV